MPIEVQSINRAKMLWGVPYLTRNQIKPTGACDKCNLLIEKKDVRFAIADRGIKTYCNNCVTKVLKEIKQDVLQTLHKVTQLNENKKYEYDCNNNTGNYIYNSNYVFVQTVRSCYKTIYLTKKDQLKDKLDSPVKCSVCSKVGLTENLKEKKSYYPYPNRGYFVNPEQIDVQKSYCNYINIGYNPPIPFCKEHAIVEIKNKLTLYDEFESEIGNHFDVNKPHILNYPTQGTIVNQEGIWLENVKSCHKCSGCQDNLEKSCIRLNDGYNDRSNYLCIKCADEYLRKRIASMTKMLETIEAVKQERCRTCPTGVQVKCLSRGVNLPDNINEPREV
jgi:hypothetical protein